MFTDHRPRLIAVAAAALLPLLINLPPLAVRNGQLCTSYSDEFVSTPLGPARTGLVPWGTDAGLPDYLRKTNRFVYGEWVPWETSSAKWMQQKQLEAQPRIEALRQAWATNSAKDVGHASTKVTEGYVH
jgi:hypothetical protein